MPSNPIVRRYGALIEQIRLRLDYGFLVKIILKYTTDEEKNMLVWA